MATLIVFGVAADNHISSNNATYTTARAGSNLAVGSTQSLMVGQDLQGGTTRWCYESFTGFDTSALTAGATVTAALLSLYCSYDGSAAFPFTVHARAKDWSTSVDTGDWVAGASLTGLTNLATLAVAGAAAGARQTFANVAMPANVNKVGSTRVILHSSRHAAGNAATTTEAVYFDTAETDGAGTTTDPKLDITYTPAPITKSAAITPYRGLVAGHANLKGYWRLGESSGTTAADEKGTYPGTYFNTPTLGVAGALVEANTAATFAGASSEYVRVNANRILQTEAAWTVEAWYKGTSAADQAIYCERAASGNDIFKLEVTGTGRARGRFRDTAGTLNDTLGLITINNNVWHHLVWTLTGTTFTLYVDGVLDITATRTATNTFTNASTESRIGGDAGDGSVYLTGSLDEVAVYNAALTAAEVKAHYDARLGGGTGGGAATLVTRKAAASALTGTGGGVSALGARKQAQAAIAATGGGAATIAYSKVEIVAKTGTVSATGGGAATMTGRKAAARSLALTGGGVLTTSATTSRRRSLILSGGGVILALQAKGGRTPLSLTAGGVATLGTRSARSSTAVLTGGGAATIAARTARSSSVVATGGGRVLYAFAHGENHSGFAVLTGGGRATVAGVHAGTGVLAATGGGAVSVTGVRVENIARSGTARLTGGGVASLAATTARFSVTRLPYQGVANAGLLGYWRLDDATMSGAAAAVVTPPGGSTVFLGTIPPSPTAGLLTGDANGAMLLDAVDRAIDQSLRAYMGPFLGPTEGITLSIVFRRDSAAFPNTYMSLMSWAGQSVPNGYHWAYINAAGMYYQYTDGVALRSTFFPMATVVGQVNHVVLAHDFATNQVRLVRNGVNTHTFNLNSNGWGPPVRVAAGQYLFVGAYAGASYLFNGVIDEPRVYGRAVSVVEAQEMYASGTLGPEPSLLMTGGGVVTRTGRKDTTRTLALTGGGVITRTGRKAAARVAALTGGGVIATSALAARRSIAAVTGGGVISLAGAASRRTQIAVTGGGVIVTAQTTARSSAQTLTGGGRVSYTYAAGTSRSGFTSLTGGGVITSSGAKSVGGSAALTGGGALAVAGVRGAQAATSVTGGGTLTTSGTKSAAASVSLTGGGRILYAYAAGENRSGFAVLTGGGTVSITHQTTRAATSSFTGGGLVTITGVRVEAGAVEFEVAGTQPAATGQAVLFSGGRVLAIGRVDILRVRPEEKPPLLPVVLEVRARQQVATGLALLHVNSVTDDEEWLLLDMLELVA